MHLIRFVEQIYWTIEIIVVEEQELFVTGIVSDSGCSSETDRTSRSLELISRSLEIIMSRGPDIKLRERLKNKIKTTQYLEGMTY